MLHLSGLTKLKTVCDNWLDCFLCQYGQENCGFHSVSDAGFSFLFFVICVVYNLVLEALIRNLVIKTYIWNLSMVFKIDESFSSTPVIIIKTTSSSFQ